MEHHGRDTETQIFFYEADFYIFSNFSAFNLWWKGLLFQTSEAAYQSEKFRECDWGIFWRIQSAPSAHEAFKIAERAKHRRRPDWNEVNTKIMKEILREKVHQHEYVKRKLLASGTRELIEDSWRDDYWGWGPNKDGHNALGKLWMEIREELRHGRPL